MTTRREPVPGLWKTAVLATSAGLGVVALLVGGVLMFSVDVREGQLPVPEDFDDIPSALSLEIGDSSCGNASCLTTVIVNGPPGMSTADILETLDMTTLSCENYGFMDFRQFCFGPAHESEGKVMFGAGIV